MTEGKMVCECAKLLPAPVSAYRLMMRSPGQGRQEDIPTLAWRRMRFMRAFAVFVRAAARECETTGTASACELLSARTMCQIDADASHIGAVFGPLFSLNFLLYKRRFAMAESIHHALRQSVFASPAAAIERMRRPLQEDGVRAGDAFIPQG